MNKLFLHKLNRSTLRIPLSQKILLTKHLSMMLKSGMSEVEALTLIKSQIKSKGFSKMLEEIIAGVQNGQFLSASLLPFERTFGKLFLNIVKLGESSGTLSENLEFLAAELKESKQIRSQVRSAMIYPIIIFVATVGVTSLLVFFVLPKILPTLEGLGGNLPITTKILIFTASSIRQYYLAIIGGIVATIISWTMLMRLPQFKYFTHRMVLSMPLIKHIVVSYNMANITRTMSILLRSGVRIVEGVSMTADLVENRVYERALREMSEYLRRGEPIFRYMSEHTNIFPPTVGHMIEVGERTGNLDSNLKYLSEFYKEQLDETLKNLSSILEPLLLILMGGVVGFVAISIITPIYEITQVF